MNTNYLLLLRRTLPAEARVPREDNVFQGQTFKMQSPRPSCLGVPSRSRGERELTRGKDAPSVGQDANVDKEGTNSVSHRPNHRAAGARGSRQPSMSRVPIQQGHYPFGKYYSAVLSLWLGGIYFRESQRARKQGLRTATTSVAWFPSRMSVEQWRAGI